MKKLVFLSFVMLLIWGCGKSDTAYMQEAKANLKKQNYSDAAQAFKSLVNKYPNSKLAPDALFQLASMYRNNMIKDISKDESLNYAAEFYGEIASKYPKYSKAPDALFMQGFIYDNDLKDYDRAKDSYNLFLQKYPENQLAQSVKEELKYMGVPAEEILKRKGEKPI